MSETVQQKSLCLTNLIMKNDGTELFATKNHGPTKFFAIPRVEKTAFRVTIKTIQTHLPVLKYLSVIERCQLLGGSLTKIATFGTKHFVRFSRHVRYLGCLLLRGFTVLKELRNRISRIIRLWSLFCSIRVYASLHFLQILLENQFFIILLFLSFLPVCVEFDVIFINFITYNIQVHVICVFVLT